MHLEWRHIWTTICTFHCNIEESQQGSGCCWQLPWEDSISFIGRGRCFSCRCHFAFYLRKHSRKTRQNLEKTKENFVEWPWVKFWSFLSSGERSSYVGWPQTVERVWIWNTFWCMVFRLMEFALKQSQSHAIEASLRRSWKNVCFCRWAPQPYIPGHAGIESPEAQVQEE